MTRYLSRSGRLAVAVTVALLAAQAITVLHRLDPADHNPGQPCEVCLAASVIGGANLAVAVIVPVVKPSQDLEAYSGSLSFSPPPIHFRPRAPPLAS